MYIRPQRELLAEKRKEIKEKTDEFNATNLPLDAMILDDYLKMTSWMLNGDEQVNAKGLNATCETTLAAATVSLDRKISQSYSDMLAFIYGATRLDYKELMEHIVSEFSDENTPFDSQLLIAEQDAQQEQPVWQMMAKLWILQDLLQKAKDSGLKLITDEEGTTQLTALPAIGYTLEDSTEGEVYILEFPVNASFRGTMTQFLAFAANLQTEECFMPIKRLSILTTPPQELIAGQNNAVDECIFNLQCSEFMVPHGLDALPETPKDDASAQPPQGDRKKEGK
ncbi:MAG: hypothetical protein MJ106_00150 [Lentisphaeria bacterium]|nr:hypothetical protein [Lentisphaeria bacterium]